jgi:hypothetical protein
MCGFLTICACCIRMKVSEKFGLGESCIMSLCMAWCCPSCSICQTHRELRYRGLPPGGICVAIMEKGEEAAGGAAAGALAGGAAGGAAGGHRDAPAAGASADWELFADEYLEKGSELESKNKAFKLIHQTDGNVVLYNLIEDRPLWSTNTCGQTSEKFIFQGDGNLVLYGPGNAVLWAANVSGAKKFVLQDDGNIVIYDGASVKWSPNTYLGNAPNDDARYHGDNLEHDEVLSQGHYCLCTESGHYLIHQTDGNVVLYNKDDKALWATNTCGQASAKFIFQGDGNVVLYGPGNEVLWSPNIHGQGGAKFLVQADGNVVVYGASNNALWATGTNGQ